jgi:RNA recognition motif-containing protein
MNSTNFSF